MIALALRYGLAKWENDYGVVVVVPTMTLTDANPTLGDTLLELESKPPTQYTVSTSETQFVIAASK